MSITGISLKGAQSLRSKHSRSSLIRGFGSSSLGVGEKRDLLQKESLFTGDSATQYIIGIELII